MTTAPCFTFLCRTKTGFGKNAMDHLPFDLSGMGANKPMVLQDDTVFQSDSTKPLIQAFRESAMILGISPAIPSDTDVDMQMVKTYYQLFVERGFDSIIAMGSGPVVTLAKALNIAVSSGPESLLHMDGKKTSLMPFVYLPVTVVTGLEASDVLMFDDLMITRPELAPDLVVIEPSIIVPRSVEEMLPQALAALSICAETFVCYKNPPARAYASTGTALVMNALAFLNKQEQALEVTSPVKSKEGMRVSAALAHASIIAGILMANHKSMISWNLGRLLGEKLAVSPGQVMAILLPAILETMEGMTPDLGDLLLPLSDADTFSRVPESQRPAAAVQKYRDLLNAQYQCSHGSVPRILEDLGVDRSAVDSVIKEINETGFLQNSIPEIEMDKVMTILMNSVDGKPVEPASGEV